MPSARTFFMVPLLLIFLAGCGSTSPDGAGPGDPPDTGDARCTYTLSGEVRMPTRLTPTGADCDYLLSGTVRVYSELTIDPGTTILAAPQSMLDIDDGGRVVAVGTAEQRIELRGSVATLGSWYGICFSNAALESRLDHVDIYWAGAVRSHGFTICRAAIGGTHGAGEPVHITNSVIVGSYTSGVDATELALGEFRNNILAGHREYGIRVSPNNMGRLDDTTNYGGIGLEYEDGSSAANGRPYVALDSTVLDIVSGAGEYQLWVPLNVPYYVTRDEFPYATGALFLGPNTSTVIAPGTQFVMAPGSLIVVEYGAVLILDGEEEAPVRFIGAAPGAGRWEGFWVYGGGIAADHAEIVGAGIDGDLVMEAAFTFSRVGGPSHCSHIRNTSIQGSAGHGVSIDEEHEGFVRVEAMTYEDIALNDIVGANTGPAVLDGESCS